jgi:polysaccharide export outer membrane protein
MQPRIKFMAVVQEDSTVTLLSNQVFTTTGKTHDEIRREVHDRYVPKFFENVRLMDMDPPFYIVRGEVWSPGMRAIYRPTTVLKAIESAGGFTPSADRKKVQLIRQEAKHMINCAKAQQDPKMDVGILAHDQIFVPRSFWK